MHRRHALLFAFLSVAVTSAAVAQRASESPFRNLGIFARALAHVETSYVEEVDQDALVYGAIRGMMSVLDPHSAFLDPDEVRVLRSDTQGRFAGIGVEISVRDGWLIVLTVFEEGPAAAAGLQPGDRFLTISGRPARDMHVQDAVRLMRGEPGTKVVVTMRRHGEEEGVVAELTRAVIEVPSVQARVLPGGIAYVRVRSFQQGTTEEVERALEAATERIGSVPSGIFLDLRDNPGGLLHEAVALTDLFVSRGTIVSTHGRTGPLSNSTASRRVAVPSEVPILTLVNGYSASAAEIVAGALADHQRAVIAGTRTFGKGSVQTIVELPDGSAMKLTIARYFTPSGRSIQALGIEPTMTIEQIDSAVLRRASLGREALREANLRGHLDGQQEPAAEEPSRDARQTPTEGTPNADSFADDFQGRTAFQALRAIIASRPSSP